MPRRATLVRLVDGDVHPRVARSLSGGGEAPAVAELGEDRDRGQLPDPAVGLVPSFGSGCTSAVAIVAGAPARARCRGRVARASAVPDPPGHARRRPRATPRIAATLIHPL